MNKILLIGNSGFKTHGIDGQTIKVRLYLKKIQDEGFDVFFVDLEPFFKKPFLTLGRIVAGIKKCDRIVLLSAERGSRVLIPFINRVNKYKKPFILPLIGSSLLHYTIDKMDYINQNDFLVNGNYTLGKRNKKIAKELARIQYILPETDLLVRVYKEFYGLDNVFKLNNFRDLKVPSNIHKYSGTLKLVFLSRVMTTKGIFDIMNVVKDLFLSGYGISLDIYGKKYFIACEEENFNLFLENECINYKGDIENEYVIQTISKYDIFVFPTLCMGEGTPGVIAESLIAGTPVLSSNFPQSSILLKNGVDSMLFSFADKQSLKEKLIQILNNPDILVELSKNACESGKRFTYDHERLLFLKYICGVE